jgi:hypothetical protein
MSGHLVLELASMIPVLETDVSKRGIYNPLKTADEMGCKHKSRGLSKSH